MPPACAIAIAICASVTVSMAEAMIGILTAIERVMWERISTSAGSTSDRPGFISTSSNVSPSRGLALYFSALAHSLLPLKAECGRQTVKKARCEGVLAVRHGPLLGWRGSIARDGADS